jgi:hypothetical protein
MKKIISLLLFVFTGILMADQIDIAVSEGTDQRVVETLIPQPAEVEADANVTIKAIFSEALNPMTVRRSVTLKKLNGEKQKSFFGFFKGKRDERVSGKVSYDANSYTVSFKPDNPLEVGFYEVSFRHLMTRNPGRDMRIKAIKYRFYVPEVINGFKLPPEPDEDKNNETLLGIDFNHNGIRDDVERWVITHYANDPKYPKTKTAIALQYAKASQYIISHDPEYAYENETFEIFDRAMDCEGYWINTVTKDMNSSTYISFDLENRIFDNTFKAKMFNTEERTKAYWQFNGSLSGHMLGGGGGVMSSTKDKCDMDIDSLGEI